MRSPVPPACPTAPSASKSLAAALAAFALSGCAFYGARPLESQHTASSMIEQRKAAGLYFAVADLSAPRDSTKYFDRDLVELGYVPVLVLLELDNDSDAVFDVRRDDLRLCLRSGKRLSTVHPDSVAEEASFSHVRSAMGFLFVLPGFFVASSVNEANSEMAGDYRRKGLDSVRINPNTRSFAGVVFFKIPRELHGKFTMEEAFVEAKAYLGGGEGTVGSVLEFPVHFGS